MSWRPEVEELQRRRARACELGGADRVQRQHDDGKLTIRERIACLVDPGSFHEVGPINRVGDLRERRTPTHCPSALRDGISED